MYNLYATSSPILRVQLFYGEVDLFDMQHHGHQFSMQCTCMKSREQREEGDQG